MARRKKGQPVHGWLVIDKPLGLSSSAVVGRVRRLLDAEKAGHGGTLDPLASGVLPIALGEATKTVAFVMDGAKAYRFTVRFGQATSTDDAEGEVIETSDILPTAEAIRAVLGEFLGDIAQIPPVYSAIKVDGERAYKRARADEQVDMKPRTVHIASLTLESVPAPGLAAFHLRCGKGTYVRALARDLARRLGTVGHVAELRRVEAGPFREEGSISLDSLETLGHSARLEKVLPLKTALDDIPALALTESEAGKLRMGQPVQASTVLSRTPDVKVSAQDTVVAMQGDTPVALARIEDGLVRPVRVLNL